MIYARFMKRTFSSQCSAMSSGKSKEAYRRRGVRWAPIMGVMVQLIFGAKEVGAERYETEDLNAMSRFLWNYNRCSYMSVFALEFNKETCEVRFMPQIGGLKQDVLFDIDCLRKKDPELAKKVNKMCEPADRLTCEKECNEMSRRGELKQGVSIQDCVKIICR